MRYGVSLVVLASLAPVETLQAQADIESRVRAFLQAWYVDKKLDEMKSFIATDNGFNLQPAPSSNLPSASRAPDPVSTLFNGAFTPPKVGERTVAPRSLSDVIEYPPAKTQSRAPRAATGVIITNEFAIYPAEALPKGSYLPIGKPAGNDKVAGFLYHLTQAYKGKLYVVLYTVKGPDMLKETAVTYWIQENGTWKIAAFMGTDW
jgi:hypothetical protein